MFIIDVRKIPRPERSGLISILSFYILTTSYFDVVGPKGDTFNLGCYFVPGLCWDWQETHQEQQVRTRRQWKYTLITFYPNAYRKGPKPCTCHVDLGYFGKPILHLHSIQEESCDNDGTTWPRIWTAPPSSVWSNGQAIKVQIVVFVDSSGSAIPALKNVESFTFYRMRAGEGEYRHHCE